VRKIVKFRASGPPPVRAGITSSDALAPAAAAVEGVSASDTPAPRPLGKIVSLSSRQPRAALAPGTVTSAPMDIAVQAATSATDAKTDAATAVQVAQPVKLAESTPVSMSQPMMPASEPMVLDQVIQPAVNMETASNAMQTDSSPQALSDPPHQTIAVPMMIAHAPPVSAAPAVLTEPLPIVPVSVEAPHANIAAPALPSHTVEHAQAPTPAVINTIPSGAGTVRTPTSAAPQARTAAGVRKTPVAQQIRRPVAR